MGVIHVVVTWKLWHFAFDRFMRGLVGTIGNPSFHQPAASVADRMADLFGRVLMLPCSELSIDIDPNYIIIANSVCWATACWILVRLVWRTPRVT
jgi:hypothetical protein